jgi:hypothetical protein
MASAGIQKFAEETIEGLVEFFYNLTATIYRVWRHPIAGPLGLAENNATNIRRVTSKTALFIACAFLIYDPAISIYTVREAIASLGDHWYERLASIIIFYLIVDLTSVVLASIFSGPFSRDRNIDRLRYAIAGSLLFLCLIVLSIPTTISSVLTNEQRDAFQAYLPDWGSKNVISVLAGALILTSPCYPTMATLGSIVRVKFNSLAAGVVGALAVPFAAFGMVRVIFWALALVSTIYEAHPEMMGTGHDCLITEDNKVIAVVGLHNTSKSPLLLVGDTFDVQFEKGTEESQKFELLPLNPAEVFLSVPANTLTVVVFTADPAGLPWPIDETESCKVTARYGAGTLFELDVQDGIRRTHMLSQKH